MTCAALIVWTLAAGAAPRGPLPAHAIYAMAIATALSAASALALWRGARQAGALVGLVAFAALLANTRMMGSADTLDAALIPIALLREGKLTLRGTEPFHAEGRYDLVAARDGRLASKYPVATALLALPVMLPVALGGAPLEARVVTAAQKLAAATLGALTVALLFLAFGALAGPREALLSAALALFGTAVLPILGQALWQHTGAALFLAAGCAALLRLDHRAHLRAALVGLCAGAVFACRPSDAPLAAALLVALASVDRKPAHLATAAAIAALPALATLAYNAAAFGHPLHTGYGDEATTGWRPAWPDGVNGFFGLLFSPGRGLFAASPILVPAVLALAWPPRGAPHRAALRWLALGVLAQALLLSRWWAWHGTYSAGPRMLSEAIPFLSLGLPLALGAALASRWRLAGLALLAGASIATNGLLAYSIPRPAGRELVWDLSRGPWAPRSWPPLAWLER
jgi:hypothetical protein